MTKIEVKRVYDTFSEHDGFRVLVDRLWPRGLKKEEIQIDEWKKELAPSPGLRKWFNHEPGKWEQFRKKYMAELEDSEEARSFKEQIENYENITLFYAAKDEFHNHALVLKEYLQAG